MTISLGTQKQVSTDGRATNVVKLTSTTAICFYSDSSANVVAAKHLTLAGGVITRGPELVIDSTALTSFIVRSVRLTDTTALLTYHHGSTHRARVISVSGTTLSPGTIKDLTDTAIESGSLSSINSTTAIYAYSDTSQNGKARILTVAAGLVTENSAFTFDANCYNVVVSALSTTKAVTAFYDNSNSLIFTAEVLDISGATITGNVDVPIGVLGGSTDDYRTAISKIDSTHVICQWQDGSDTVGVVLTQSGGTVSAGSIVTATNAGTRMAIDVLSAFIAIGVLAAPVGAQFVIIEWGISGTTISEDDTEIISVSGVTGPWVAALSATVSIATWDGTTEAVSASVPFSGYDLVLGGGQP